MSNLDVMLPRRPLRFTGRPWAQGMGLVLLSMLAFVGAGFIGWFQLPGLLQDFSIRANPLPIADYQLRDAECKSRKAVFTDCSADVAYEVDGVRYDQHVELMFFALGGSDYETGLVVHADDPAKATLTIGLDRLGNRVAMMAVMLGGLALMGIGGVVVGLRGMRINREARRPQAWTVEVVGVESVGKAFGGTTANYLWHDAIKRKDHKGTSRFWRKSSPLWLQAADGTPLLLALRPATGGVPLLLDAELRRIDLTDDERVAALAALDDPGAPAADARDDDSTAPDGQAPTPA